jgi:hypothetical protein
VTAVRTAFSRFRQCRDRRRSVKQRGKLVHIRLEIFVAADEGKAISVELLAELARQQQSGGIHGVAAGCVEGHEVAQDLCRVAVQGCRVELTVREPN